VKPKAHKDDSGYDARVLETFVAALRRYLVDEEFMQRKVSVYWRTGSVPNVGYDPPDWPLG
jgi:hypothetical protein